MAERAYLISLLPLLAALYTSIAAEEPSSIFDLSSPMLSYHSHEAMTKVLQQLERIHSKRAYLYPIGESVQKRELWALAISAQQPSKHVFLRPEVAIIANLHGNEAVGRELLLYLADYLLSSYGRDENVTQILNETRIHLLPSANPDGFAMAGAEGHCDSRYGRENSRGVDLNRDFPDRWHSNDSKPRIMEPETMAIMKWLGKVPFALAANLHGGAVVACYPWDSTSNAQSHYSKTPDDDILQDLALTYSQVHPLMAYGTSCTGAEVFPKGISNGADWYAVFGSLQDYQYAFRGIMALTVEVACCKYPVATALEQHWKENKQSLLAFIGKGSTGVRGQVTDDDGSPVADAKLMVKGRDIYFSTTPLGEFWRILLPESYTLMVRADGFVPQLVNFTVPTGKGAYSIVNVKMIRVSSFKKPMEKRKQGES